LTTSTTAGTDGRFTFTGIEPVAGRNYVATADYQGVLYASAIAAFPGNTPALDLPLTVYETTADIGAVQVGRLHLVFDFASDGVVQVLELWLLSNTGDRTVFTADQGLIDITLPEGASGLSFDGGTVGDRFELTPTGFRDRRELVPGENTGEIIFSYNLPYDGSSKLDRQAPYPVMATVAMVSGEGPQVSGDGFTDMGLRQVSGMSLHTYQRGPAQAGETISLELSGQPTAAAAPSTSTQVAPVIAAAAALALALIAAVLIWFRPWRRRARPAPAAEQAGDEDAALWAIASLDYEFAEGKIDPASYQARRAELIRRAQEASHRD
jgi:hypothetical protein